MFQAFPIAEVAFSTDGVYAATGSYDGTVRRTCVVFFAPRHSRIENNIRFPM